MTRRNGDDYGEELAGEDVGVVVDDDNDEEVQPETKGKPPPLTRRRSFPVTTNGKQLSPKMMRGG